VRFSYPCEVSRDSETGQVILECKNPSAFAFGDSLEEALKEMHSLLLDCVSDYIDEGKIFPTVSALPLNSDAFEQIHSPCRSLLLHPRKCLTNYTFFRVKSIFNFRWDEGDKA
jgi:predicted RNase H-like HicB family nuclease